MNNKKRCTFRKSRGRNWTMFGSLINRCDCQNCKGGW